MSEFVIVQQKGQTGRIRLNRPTALNALTHEMTQTIIDALLDWRSDDRIARVLVDHMPDYRGFCAGGDIRQIVSARTSQDITDFVANECRLSVLIATYPKPYIAVTNGITMGAGMGLAVHGSHRIATEKTLMAMPETSIGLFPDTGVGWLLSRLPDEIGTWMALTSARLKAAETALLGLATHYAPSQDLEDIVQAVHSDGIAALEEIATATATGRTLAEDGEMLSFAVHLDRIRTCFSAGTLSEICSRLADSGDWGREQRDIILSKCPTSLKLALRQFRREAAMSDFAEVMQMEYRLACRMAQRGDFREGVRAAVIDKDGAPHWSPARLEDVSDEEIEALFAPLPDGDVLFS